MNKRIASLLLSLFLLFSIIPAATHAHATAQSVITVEADKATVKPGDTVTFTVYLQSSLEVYGIQFFMDIPQGLTYVAGSGKVIPGTAATLGVDGDCSWTEHNLQITMGGTAPLKNISAEKLAVATFQCTVDANATGSLTVNTTTYYNGKENFGGITVRRDGKFMALPASEFSLAGAEIAVQTDPVFYATVEAEKSEAPNGGEIKFTVYVQSSVDVYGIHLLMDIPQGLTYVPGSGAVVSGIASTLGADGDCSWTENNLQITLGGTSPLKNIKTNKLAVATFKCTVDANAAGSLRVNTTTSYNGTENIGGITALQAGRFIMLPDSHLRLSPAEVKIVSATHNWDAALTTDENGHWYACSHCEEKGSYAAHDFENACDPNCSICGYTHETQHTLAAGWTANANAHWHICSVCGVMQDEANHQLGAEATATTAQTCTVCGYEIVPALGVAEATTPPATTDTSTTPSVTDEHPDPSVTPEPNDPTAPSGQDDASDSSFPWWILLVVAVVLAGAAVIILVSPKKKSRF